MAEIIKKLAIKNATGTGFDSRDIGIDAINGTVARKSDGTIVTSTSETASTTENLAVTLKTHETNINKKAPTAHASTATTYGVATSSNYGHVKTSTGITNSSGTISVTYGTAAGTACQGNDGRLSDKRTNPQILTISNGLASPTTVQYDGSAAKTIDYNTVGAAPKAHASTATTYGVASSTNYGHVKTSTGITNSSGVISVKYSTAEEAGAACQANDSRLKNARTPVAHASTTTNYGGGTNSNFGHTKLTDDYNVSSPNVNTNGAATSIAPSAYALQQAYKTLNTAISGKAPTAHASTATTYGVATTANYGHVKFGTTAGTAAEGNHSHSNYDNALTDFSYSAAAGIGYMNYTTAAGAGQKIVDPIPVQCGGTGALNAATARTNLGAAPTDHASTATTYGIGTASNYGHLKISDIYNEIVTPSTGVAASQMALYYVADHLKEIVGNLTNPNGFYLKISFGGYKVLFGYANFGACEMTSVYGNGYFCAKTLTLPNDVSDIRMITVGTVGEGGGFFKVGSYSGNTVNLYAISSLSETQNMICNFVVWYY